jgi:hypothetical protein
VRRAEKGSSVTQEDRQISYGNETTAAQGGTADRQKISADQDSPSNGSSTPMTGKFVDLTDFKCPTPST